MHGGGGGCVAPHGDPAGGEDPEEPARWAREDHPVQADLQQDILSPGDLRPVL